MLKHGFVIFSGIRSATHTSKSLARALHTRRHIFPTRRSADRDGDAVAEKVFSVQFPASCRENLTSVLI